MSIVHMDSFEMYGTDETNMTDGMYSEVTSGSGSWNLSTTNARTSTYAMRRGTNTGARLIRYALPSGATTTVGQGLGLYMDQAPANSQVYCIFDFRDSANNVQISITVNSARWIEVIRGEVDTGTSLGTSGSPAVATAAWTHIEAWVTFDNSAGSVEVRVDGVTVISLSGVDTVDSANIECSQVAICCGSNRSADATAHSVTSDIDDYFVADDSGAQNNDFIGDRRVYYLAPTSDGVQQDWSPSTGSDGYAMIDEVDPNDDTDYIDVTEAGSPLAFSEFGMANLAAGVASVTALSLVHRSLKTDAGTANIQASIISNSAESAGADNAITTAYTYYEDIIELDPDTGSAFTPSAVDAVELKLTRTA